MCQCSSPSRGGPSLHQEQHCCWCWVQVTTDDNEVIVIVMDDSDSSVMMMMMTGLEYRVREQWHQQVLVDQPASQDRTLQVKMHTEEFLKSVEELK